MANKAWRWFSLLLIASLILAGCGSLEAAEKRPPLRVEWTDWDGDYTLLVAEEKGIFEKYGVEVEPVYYSTFSKTTPDLAARKLDGGLFGIQDMLTANSVTPIKTVAVYDSGGTVAVVAHSEIKSIADLSGQKIGVPLGSYGDLFVREMLKSYGMNLKEVELVNLDPSLVLEALSNGTIAAGYVWAPLDQQAVQEGHKILYTQTASLQAPDVIVFRGDIVEARPDDIRAFLSAWFEAAAFRESNRQESEKIIASITGNPLNVIAHDPNLKLYNREDNLRYFANDPGRDDTIYALTQNNLDFKITRGDITFSPDLMVILDASFLQSSVAGQGQ